MSSSITEPFLSGDSPRHDEEEHGHESHFQTAEQRMRSPFVAAVAGVHASHPPDGRTLRLRKSMRKAAGAAPRARRSTWICMDSEGKKTYMHADKRAILGKIGLSIPIRDMRLLDYNLVQDDSIILVRENAIIASLEHVRLIIMHDKVVMPREGVEENPLASSFLAVLDEAILEWLEEKAHFEEHLQQEHDSRYNLEHAKNQDATANEETSSISDLQQETIEPLPFELVVLETALKDVISSISSKAEDIERVIVPAMDSLMKSVNPSNLERVRKVKTRLQRITTRCEAVRDELQRFLQDDEDMDRMCLSRKREIEEDLTKNSSPRASMDMQFVSGNNNNLPTNNNSVARSMMMSSSFSHRRGMLLRNVSPLPTGPGQQGGLSNSLAQEEDLEADAEAHLEVENLLESYFMQVDTMFDKLVTVGEYIKDTEEYINIELDSSRNRLIRMDIILSVAAFALMPFNLVAGILGENLIIPEQITGKVSQFYTVNIVAALICMMTFYGIMVYMRSTKVI